MLIVRTVLVLVIIVVVRLKNVSIIAVMSTHGGGIGVRVMQATSKHNVRTKCDERQAMNGASKHGYQSPKVRAEDCSQLAGLSQSQLKPASAQCRSIQVLWLSFVTHAPCQLAKQDELLGTSQ